MRTNHTDSLSIKIIANDRGNPPGKLADAELHFGEKSPLTFTENALDRIRKAPGVESVATAYGVPVKWDGWRMSRIAIDGNPP
jgi:hypothetical protein